ncbi:MAG: class II aldolase/adducin family protein [Hahellaceae bacterium]|nr:class II aldolase/adducin family protein [Hahellaceae bacterium]
MSDAEGVIKYTLEFEPVTLARLDSSLMSLVAEIDQWRQVFMGLGLIGQVPERYHGLGFGNMSIRYSPLGAFLITGSQTSGLEWLSAEDCALVSECDVARNRLVAQGNTPPSSEAMTHGALYQQSMRVGAVIHVHSPVIWHASAPLELPVIPEHIPYGTPAMADAVRQLWKANSVAASGVFAMLGHEDGVVAWGDNIADASMALLRVFSKAHRSSSMVFPD